LFSLGSCFFGRSAPPGPAARSVPSASIFFLFALFPFFIPVGAPVFTKKTQKKISEGSSAVGPLPVSALPPPERFGESARRVRVHPERKNGSGKNPLPFLFSDI
jgi:hypothetical protein